MKCDCNDWVRNNKELHIVFTKVYLKVKEFTHCPYCGEGLVPDYKCSSHCFCRNDALGVLHCCKCGESIKYEYKPYEWRVGVPDYKWVMPNWRASSVEEDNAMSSYVRGKYASGPTSSDEFAMRKEI